MNDPKYKPNDRVYRWWDAGIAMEPQPLPEHLIVGLCDW